MNDEINVHVLDLKISKILMNKLDHPSSFSHCDLSSTHIPIQQDQLTISVRDHGEGFDPTTLPDPLDPLNLLNPAGRGILYMRTFMDDVAYHRHPEGGMLVTMAKRRQPLVPPAEPADPVVSAHLEGGESIGNVLGD